MDLMGAPITMGASYYQVSIIEVMTWQSEAGSRPCQRYHSVPGGEEGPEEDQQVYESPQTWSSCRARASHAVKRRPMAIRLPPSPIWPVPWKRGSACRVN